jgi:anti-sigma factor RsiW
MHPDHRQLAAYLDGALDPARHAELRAHILTCATCTARLERLRDDARRIAAALASGGATPDVRAAVRARLRRPALGAWLTHGLALAGACSHC